VVPLAVPPPPPMSVERGDHVLVLARITRDKGQDIAARVCRSAGVPLVLAGPVAGVGDPGELERRLREGDATLASHPDVQYFVDEVRPLLDGDRVRWVGGVGGLEKERLLRSARALLAPNRWAEPGATGVVEALTRGVPAVATPLGALPSLIEHGVTGFLGDTEDDLADCLRQLHRIDPSACRAAAAAWTPRAMAEKYVALYHRLLEREEPA
jgi:glycosyltransferase involved in cell wall biosynthesis